MPGGARPIQIRTIKQPDVRQDDVGENGRPDATGAKTIVAGAVAKYLAVCESGVSW